MAPPRAAVNRKIRQDALREWLSEKCTAQHLVDNLIKIEKLDVTSETFSNDLNKYKIANDQRIKIMSKYLPDLKQTEIDLTADITAREHTRAELESKLLSQGFDISKL